MEVYSTEEQQVEAIKKFWSENGKQIVLGALIGLGGFVGWKQYVNSQVEAQEAASAQFEQFIETTQAEGVELDSAQAELQKLLATHGDTGYAIFANLITAKKAVESADFAKALEYLQSASAQVSDDSLKGLVDTRVARVQLQLEQYQAALTTLDSISNEGYVARVAELKGDVYLAQGDATKARMEYQKAADNGGLEGNNLLQMKLDDLTSPATASNG